MAIFGPQKWPKKGVPGPQNDQKPEREWGRFNGKSALFGVQKWTFWTPKMTHFLAQKWSKIGSKRGQICLLI